MIRYILIVLTILKCIQCKFSHRIINGKIVMPADDYKFVVNIKLRKEHFCGGALISLKAVLTAAHCFTSLEDEELKQLVVYAGRVDTDDNRSPRRIQNIYSHPNHNSSTNSYDISVAIVLISFALDFRNVRVIQIAPKGFVWPIGDYGKIFGWGRTEDDTFPLYLKTANITMVSKDICRKMVATEIQPVDDTMECAGGTGDGQDSCTSDSGGPLVHFNTGYLIGIISWGIGCGLKNIPGVYTSVSYFHDWIEEQLNNERNLYKVPPTYSYHRHKYIHSH